MVGPKCPLCRKQESKLYRVGIRENSSQPVWGCTYCGLVFLENAIPDLREYYRSTYRTQHDAIPGGVQLTAEQRFHLQYEFAKPSVAKFTAEVPEGASVLEVGCSAGGFLAHLSRDKRYDCYGCEWNPEDAAFVRDVGELPCEEGTLEEVYPGKRFTAIVALAVLEHVEDPLAFMRACRERLIGGGWLYMETPNINDALLSMYGLNSYANFWFREPHLTYWKPETIAALCNTSGFEARIHWYQRYALHNHINWILNGVPMTDPVVARKPLRPVKAGHPGAGALNRIWDQLAAEYRVQMETLDCADTLTIMARRRQI